MKTFIAKFEDSFTPVMIRAYSKYSAKQKARIFYKGRKLEYIDEQVTYELVHD